MRNFQFCSAFFALVFCCFLQFSAFAADDGSPPLVQNVGLEQVTDFQQQIFAPISTSGFQIAGDIAFNFQFAAHVLAPPGIAFADFDNSDYSAQYAIYRMCADATAESAGNVTIYNQYEAGKGFFDPTYHRATHCSTSDNRLRCYDVFRYAVKYTTPCAAFYPSKRCFYLRC